MGVNRALRTKGHYLCVLTSNSFTRGFTTEKDFENICHVIENYGFDIVQNKQLQGRADDQVALSPFYFIHAIKKKSHTTGLSDTVDPLEIYPPYVTVLTGGKKYERIIFNPAQRESRITTCPLPDTFIEEDGTIHQQGLTTQK